MSAFDGRVYGLVDGVPDALHGPGDGRSRRPTDNRLVLSSFSLRYLFEKSAISVESSIEHRSPDEDMRAKVAILQARLPRRPRFPLLLTVEKARHRVEVDGRARVFTVYSCGDRSTAYGKVGPVDLKIEFPARLLGRFALQRLDEQTVSAALQERRK